MSNILSQDTTYSGCDSFLISCWYLPYITNKCRFYTFCVIFENFKFFHKKTWLHLTTFSHIISDTKLESCENCSRAMLIVLNLLISSCIRDIMVFLQVLFIKYLYCKCINCQCVWHKLIAWIGCYFEWLYITKNVV